MMRFESHRLSDSKTVQNCTELDVIMSGLLRVFPESAFAATGKRDASFNRESRNVPCPCISRFATKAFQWVTDPTPAASDTRVSVLAQTTGWRLGNMQPWSPGMKRQRRKLEAAELSRTEGCAVKREILALIDRSRGVWVVQYRDRAGEMIVEPTAYPANTPSIVVSDELQKERPEFAVFAKINWSGSTWAEPEMLRQLANQLLEKEARIMGSMKHLISLLISVALIAGPGAAMAQQSNKDKVSVKQTTKDVANDTKKAAKATGKAVKKTTKKVVNKAATETKKGAEKVEDKTKSKK
jgi:hypothetical protein